MTASLFKITPTPPTSIELRPGEDGRLSFTIESLAAPGRVHEIMLQALHLGRDGKGEEVDWLVVGPRRTLTMPGGKTETATITVRPPSDVARGEHGIKLVIADRDRPNDVYADSPPVAVEISLPIEVKEPPRKTPWWLIAAIVGGVLLVGGGVLLVWKLAGGEPGTGGLGEACGGEAGDTCDEGLLCVGRAARCLLAGGARCEPDKADLCASGQCVGSRRVCAIPIGGDCDPNNKLVPCASNGICISSLKKCIRRPFPIPVGRLEALDVDR